MQLNTDRTNLEAGRRAFGSDPLGYDRARPAYPAELALWLRAAAPSNATRILEIGPGTGRATRLLLNLNPSRILAVEPDARLADFLTDAFPGEPSLQILRSSFEAAELPANSFEMGAAATSFHWLDPQSALPKLHRLLVPGGQWCMWWNLFGDREHPDAFELASTPLFRRLTPDADWRLDGRAPFALETEKRRTELEEAGFEKVEFQRLHWLCPMRSAEVVALAATFSQVSLAAPEPRRHFLLSLGELVDREFGGLVERHFSTAFYTARKPSRSSKC